MEFLRFAVHRGLEVLFRALYVTSVVAVVEGLEATDDSVQPIEAGGEGFKLGEGHSSLMIWRPRNSEYAGGIACDSSAFFIQSIPIASQRSRNSPG